MIEPFEHPTTEALGEAEVRRRLDGALGRALTDPALARALLSEPTLALGGAGCTPQQRLELRDIRARDLKDFAAQATELFWPARHSAALESGRLAVAAGQ